MHTNKVLPQHPKELYTVKKWFAVFLSLAGLSLTKLSLAGNKQITPL
jgi:hypothetical protein